MGMLGTVNLHQYTRFLALVLRTTGRLQNLRQRNIIPAEADLDGLTGVVAGVLLARDAPAEASHELQELQSLLVQTLEASRLELRYAKI